MDARNSSTNQSGPGIPSVMFEDWSKRASRASKILGQDCGQGAEDEVVKRGHSELLRLEEVVK
jgi:hypothetical protein